MSESDKRKNYTEYPKRAYNYYKKYGLFRTLRRVLRWVGEKTERHTVNSDLAGVNSSTHDLALKGFYLHGCAIRN